jgi:hypothetical protein
MRHPRWKAPLFGDGKIRPALFRSKLALDRVRQNDVIEYDEKRFGGTDAARDEMAFAAGNQQSRGTTPATR